MRKISHITLAKYLADNIEVQGITIYRRSFYIGSILPDCTPSFITKRHTIEDTFDILRLEIRNITTRNELQKEIDATYYRHLGIITHYLADYFTYPHTKNFNGSIKEHCSYEKDLIQGLLCYVNEREHTIRKSEITWDNPEQYEDELSKYILDKHQEYLEYADGIEVDCKYIVEICSNVLDAIHEYHQYSCERYKKVEIAEAI
ncbi:zinc dependent phospholipase C family protein [Anaeromicropila herbilytica]|uniref:Phospholipase C/D domain-containing protein n=1 Tax=Anaeromicropila herbilytica TaxID=2785025 RepID=A0A7R7EK72_9FIRM|nr:zinc dependent phospholipase C family protein [Anaeromicropila herbilytica]BCN30254.1 hypothetical protein bsdtb5_15490 [Anaeromicropila herbilytica]